MALCSVILSGQRTVGQEGSRAAPLPSGQALLLSDLGSSSTAQLLSQELSGSLVTFIYKTKRLKWSLFS